MKILIDARMYGLEHAGIGRYVMNLVHQLVAIDKSNNYQILLKNNKQQEDLISNFKFSLKTSNFKFQIVNIPHYSLQEQLELPKILSQLDFDLAHFPHFNVPIFFNKPYAVTIHDLINHSYRGRSITTRFPLLYWIKYLGYKFGFSSAVYKAKKIIVPSKAVKDDLLSYYEIDPSRIEVTYEGVDEVFSSKFKVQSVKFILNKYKIKTPYIIYTGSAYPHKNLSKLIRAVKILNERYQLNEKLLLVLASSRSVFTERLMEFIRSEDADDHVKFLGFIPDKDLAQLYKSARAFISPSFSEGFGLPAVEAMASGCPIVCSNIPVFREVYFNAPIYFNPSQEEDIAKSINQVISLSKQERARIIQKGFDRAKQFSWEKMAEETLKVYEKILR